MKRYLLRVAGFTFAVEMPEPYMAQMINYAPFLIDDDEHDLLFLLHVGVDHHSEVVQPVFVDSSDEDMPRIEVSKTREGWLLEESITRDAPIALHLYATEDFREAWLMVSEQQMRFGMDNAAMLLFAFTTAKRGALEMHASVTVKADYGYLFLGKSGTGKSTHSRLWHEAFGDKVWLLNDDNPIVRIEDDGAYVYGSPWSGKTPCYKNERVRIGAIVKLAQAPLNRIRTLRLPEAYAYVLSSASGLKIVPDMMDALYDTIAQLIQSVQVYGMECLPDTDAARLCATTVEKNIVTPNS